MAAVISRFLENKALAVAFLNREYERTAGSRLLKKST
jgi:hypothetical protein